MGGRGLQVVPFAPPWARAMCDLPAGVSDAWIQRGMNALVEEGLLRQKGNTYTRKYTLAPIRPGGNGLDPEQLKAWIRLTPSGRQAKQSQARRLSDSGESQRAIAAALGVTQMTIFRWLKIELKHLLQIYRRLIEYRYSTSNAFETI